VSADRSGTPPAATLHQEQRDALRPSDRRGLARPRLAHAAGVRGQLGATAASGPARPAGPCHGAGS